LQVREGRILQRSKEELRASKLPPNQKIRIITILHQLFNPPARAAGDFAIEVDSDQARQMGPGIIKGRKD
jgi:hypothetical protein